MGDLGLVGQGCRVWSKHLQDLKLFSGFALRRRPNAMPVCSSRPFTLGRADRVSSRILTQNPLNKLIWQCVSGMC